MTTAEGEHCQQEGSSPKNTPLDSKSSGSSVIVEVGSSHTEFSVDEVRLAKYSGFFMGAMNGHFMESKTRMIPLHEDDPDIFKHLVDWVHTGKLDRRDENAEGARKHKEIDGKSVRSEDEDEQLLRGVQELFRLWILGDKLQMPEIQNAITRELIDMATRDGRTCTRIQIPDNETLELVYDNSLDTSPLRSLAIDMALLTGAAHGLVGSMRGLSSDILVDAASRAVTFWNQETSCSPLAKNKQLIGAQACYAVGTPLMKSLVLSCPHMTSSEAHGCDTCHHQKRQGGHLACRNMRLGYEGKACWLRAECEARPGMWRPSRLNLDEIIANHDGEFFWAKPGETGNFSRTARNLELTDGDNVLVGELQNERGNFPAPACHDTTVMVYRSRLVLSEKIINSFGKLKYVP
ncbi:BTB/POZ domain containing protein [Neofusicoccum parvum]|uniref:BTB/POZ domain containing protein n=1 Tax=Neofusicoccum parvum TaxID=310453 RepID=A0ACB5SFQ6_9PEZI|nr:BTB/POZ domain containing protein [Neofusicoccum parvum]